MMNGINFMAHMYTVAALRISTGIIPWYDFDFRLITNILFADACEALSII